MHVETLQYLINILRLANEEGLFHSITEDLQTNKALRIHDSNLEAGSNMIDNILQ